MCDKVVVGNGNQKRRMGMASKSRIINDMGTLYRITDKNWQKFLTILVETGRQDAEEFLNNKRKRIGFISSDITDMSEYHAEIALESINKELSKAGK